MAWNEILQPHVHMCLAGKIQFKTGEISIMIRPLSRLTFFRHLCRSAVVITRRANLLHRVQRIHEVLIVFASLPPLL